MLRRLGSPCIQVHNSSYISGLKPWEFRIVDLTSVMLLKKTECQGDVLIESGSPVLIY